MNASAFSSRDHRSEVLVALQECFEASVVCLENFGHDWSEIVTFSLGVDNEVTLHAIGIAFLPLRNVGVLDHHMIFLTYFIL